MPLPMPKLSMSERASFESRAGGRSEISFEEFVDWALYDSDLGYYRKNKERVEKKHSSDFYTSSSLCPLFGELVVDACLNLLGARDPSEYEFVEIGAEPGKCILKDLDHPFKDLRVLGLGCPLEVPERAIIFSNEWLDAQPFRRFRFCGDSNQWKESFVRVEGGELREVWMEMIAPPGFELPRNARSGNLFDWPTGSIRALQDLLGDKRWSGLFLTMDYGLDQATLLNDRPDGTARAYFRHKTEPNLLARPGEQDLTCHLCWNALIDCLEANDFSKTTLQKQESFFVLNAQNKIKETISAHRGGYDRSLQTLKELLHPAHLGHSMQALYAERF